MKSSAAFALLYLFVALSSAIAQTPENYEFTVNGTLNAVLANGSGMVVLTDSMLSSGGHPFSKDGQKLFRLDEQTVCAIAGFVSAGPSKVPVPGLYVNTASIINRFRSELKGKPPQPIEMKITALAFLMLRKIGMISRVRVATGVASPNDSYEFSLIVAGYDTDGFLKVGKVQLDPAAAMFYPPTPSISVVGKDFQKVLGGQTQIAEDLLENKHNSASQGVLGTYWKSIKEVNGSDLTLDQLTDLAMLLLTETSSRVPTVGGARQMAIFANGKLVSHESPIFSSVAESDLDFNLIASNTFRGGRNPFALNTLAVFVSNFYSGTMLDLDGHYWFGNNFNNAVLRYNGGFLCFDPSNKTSTSRLILGLNASLNPEAVRQLTAAQWMEVLEEREKP